jgi:hypothetical protein
MDVRNWTIPKDIKLADDGFYEPGDIDPLIGVDIFYEIFRSDDRTHPGNYPVL